MLHSGDRQDQHSTLLSKYPLSLRLAGPVGVTTYRRVRNTNNCRSEVRHDLRKSDRDPPRV